MNGQESSRADLFVERKEMHTAAAWQLRGRRRRARGGIQTSVDVPRRVKLWDDPDASFHCIVYDLSDVVVCVNVVRRVRPIDSHGRECL